MNTEWEVSQAVKVVANFLNTLEKLNLAKWELPNLYGVNWKYYANLTVLQRRDDVHKLTEET